jgi:hypothetical protein
MKREESARAGWRRCRAPSTRDEMEGGLASVGANERTNNIGPVKSVKEIRKF